MASCPKAQCKVAQKREKLINDFQELIDCMQKTVDKPPGQILVHKKLVCVPCPPPDAHDCNTNSTKHSECKDDTWKANRYKSRELKSSILKTGCDCLKRNGLQHDCPRSDCMGRPPCLLKPWPDCLPSGGSGLRGAEPRVSKYPYRPAPCPAPDFPPGYTKDPCHKAEVDCPKCKPVLMCRPGEIYECKEQKCPPNMPSSYKYKDDTCNSKPPECRGSNPCAAKQNKCQTHCPNKPKERLPTNVIGQEIICVGPQKQYSSDSRSRDLAERQRQIGCPKKDCHQRPGYETPQMMCRPADPQPVQQIHHSPDSGCKKHCDAPTHVLKRPAYEPKPEPPLCPKPQLIHHPGGKILPNYTQLRASHLLTRCDCLRTNGLQDDCQLRQCGIPECLMRPPDCLPAGGRGPRPNKRSNSGHCPGSTGGKDSLSCPAGYQRYICYSPAPAADYCYS